MVLFAVKGDFAKLVGTALFLLRFDFIFSSCLLFAFSFSRSPGVMESAQLGWRVGAGLLLGSGSGIFFCWAAAVYTFALNSERMAIRH